jgi:hypothetical protein
MRPYYRKLLLPAGTGFHFGAPIPPDLASPRYLQAADAEDVICSVLAYAQQGRFEPCTRLLDLLVQHDDADVWGSCSTLLSFAAPRSVLAQLVPLAERLRIERKSDAPLQWAGETLARCHEAWVIPVILRLFEQIRAYDRVMALPVYLSMLLETEPAEIDAGPRRLRDPDDPDWYEPPPKWDVPGYVRMVEQRHLDVIAMLPNSERSCVFDGDLLTLRGVAMRALGRVNETRENQLRIAEARMLLEAYTGEDFSGFYDEHQHRLRPLRASARLEAFLQDDTPERFTPGARYFFGFRVPD